MFWRETNIFPYEAMKKTLERKKYFATPKDYAIRAENLVTRIFRVNFIILKFLLKDRDRKIDQDI
jgi:hypothetical protein